MSTAALRAAQRRYLKRYQHARPTFALDVAGEVLELGGSCGLYVDMAPDEPAPMRGDWVATNAGSRYLVDDVRPSHRARRAQQKRYRLRCLRLPKHAEPPADVHVIWLQWYPRGRRS